MLLFLVGKKPDCQVYALMEVIVMKRLRCWFVSTGFLIPLFWGTTAVAQTDLLNLAAYPEGAPMPHSENVVVAVDENTGEKWLTNTPGKSARNLIFHVNLTGTTEIFIRRTGGLTIDFMVDNENYIRLFGSHDLSLDTISNGSITSSDRGCCYSELSELKLSLSGYIAKLYDNEDKVIAQVTLTQPFTYTLIKINSFKNGINDLNRLYELTVKSDGIIPITVPTSCDVGDRFEEGKQAGIQQCVDDPTSCGITGPNVVSLENGCMATYSIDGQLNIPCLLVPDLFGNQTIYQVDMQQQLPSFVFDVDLDSVKPR
ncbi:hypothetical protein BGP_0196 [Beggiatoa sp. PS]|nr:hypothetical protein BGP_0196 [Beggiatoa sp. PS]